MARADGGHSFASGHAGPGARLCIRHFFGEVAFFSCFARHLASFRVARLFCFLRFGESWGADMPPGIRKDGPRSNRAESRRGLRMETSATLVPI